MVKVWIYRSNFSFGHGPLSLSFTTDKGGSVLTDYLHALVTQEAESEPFTLFCSHTTSTPFLGDRSYTRPNTEICPRPESNPGRLHERWKYETSFYITSSLSRVVILGNLVKTSSALRFLNGGSNFDSHAQIHRC